MTALDVDRGELLAPLDRSARDAPDGDAADELVVVDGGDLHLQGAVGIDGGARHDLQDEIEERREIDALVKGLG